ncbi:hypothetical protein MRS44_003929 [Fusarium solani]|uniref:uncharacterized protein n=1 Tax=Fusarium solani TaxID=169388 RepID=UPI0032C408AE|nr:hypothetical protein MRS44_003929 [Fusarium solani]
MPLPEQDNFFKAFFKDNLWLENAKKSGHSVYIIGPDLEQLFSEKDVKKWNQQTLFLVSTFFKYNALKSSLQPYVRHTHGRSRKHHDLVFEEHDVILNVTGIYQDRLSDGIPCQHPEKLSYPTADGRETMFLEYGQGELQRAKVRGLGQDARPDESVAAICEVQLKDDYSVLISLWPTYFFRISKDFDGWERAKDYHEKVKSFVRMHYSHCEACTMKQEIPDDAF